MPFLRRNLPNLGIEATSPMSAALVNGSLPLASQQAQGLSKRQLL